MSARDTVREVERELAAAGVPEARVDAEHLVAHVLGVPRSRLGEPNGALDSVQRNRLELLVRRRASREPLQYVLGEWGFRRLTLAVDPRALIPRPETEALVDRCLALLEGVAGPRILDVGTGSGAIALALLDEHPGSTAVGVDVSAGALTLAAENAERTGLAGRVEFRQGDLLEPVSERFHLVASNPPYVPRTDLASLQPEIGDWEPDVAIVDAGQTEAIAAAAREALRPGGALVLEMSDTASMRLAGALHRLGYEDVLVTRDYAGVERVIEGRWP